jgi:putative PIN family toxin of toxin-antitoxin system
LKAVLDTNVLVSGVFFSGPPYEILSAWRHGRFKLVLSAEILDEYRVVGHRLAVEYQGVDIGPILALLAVHAEFVAAPPLVTQVCDDPTDDKFFACALASGCKLIVSGDRHLHKASGYAGVQVVRPREFVTKYLAG